MPIDENLHVWATTKLQLLVLQCCVLAAQELIANEGRMPEVDGE